MKNSTLLILSSCLFIFLILTLRELAAAPITFNTALPVARDEKVVRIQTKLMLSTDDLSGADRDLTVWTIPLVIAYGVTEKLALFGILPVLDKEIMITSATGRLTRGESGIGDFTAMARYTAWKIDAPGKTIRLAPFVALKMPTGEDRAEDSLGILPQPLQLGSGAWDYSLGMVVTRQTLAREIDLSISYTLRTKANEFEFGDEVRIDTSYQHRVWPCELSSGVPGFVYAVLESNLIWQDNNRSRGIVDNNSGGITWFFAPGIQYVTKRTVLELVVQVPVVQDLNGVSLKNDFISTVSFRMNF